MERRGVLHRDLKPSNVMLIHDSVTPSGERAKVVDLGIWGSPSLRGSSRRRGRGAGACSGPQRTSRKTTASSTDLRRACGGWAHWQDCRLTVTLPTPALVATKSGIMSPLKSAVVTLLVMLPVKMPPLEAPRVPLFWPSRMLTF